MDRLDEKLMTVHEVSGLTGVSIRTLHYYDGIGLLSPKVTTDAGYRMYDDTCLERLRNIMLFRELEFPLKDIKNIIDNPDFDRKRALEDQIRLLELKREHLDGLIDFAKKLKQKGESDMSFKAFDKSKIKEYQARAKEAWGNTGAYKEYEEKAAKQTEVEMEKTAEEMMTLFVEFGSMKDMNPGDTLVQEQVKKLQDFITEKYYTCTNEILSGLGMLYVAGDDMTKNIDAAGGEGCARFVAKAIEIYCEK